MTCSPVSAGPPGPPPGTTLTARTPEDVLAAVPVVLGFEPRESVVMLTFGGAETFHARLDLPPTDEPDEVAAAVSLLLEPAVRHRVARVLFVCYCDDTAAFRATLRALRDGFDRAGLEVVEVLRAHAGRWFAPGRPGAPPGGVAYAVADHRFRAQAVLDGIVVHGSRAELEAGLAPDPAGVRATARALRTATPSPPDELADLVELRLAQGRFGTAELARVLLGLQDLAGRDAAWAAMTRAGSPSHVRLWGDAVQRAPAELVAAPAAVLAVAAWLAGHGALAWCAVDRAREADPDSSLARLVADLLTQAVPPSAWPGPQPVRGAR